MYSRVTLNVYISMSRIIEVALRREIRERLIEIHSLSTSCLALREVLFFNFKECLN